MIDKRQWFDVPDSLTEREDGKGEYCNVEARFVDHPVLNSEKSHIARYNVYDLGIQLQTRAKRAGGDAKAQPNMVPITLRFDKGLDETHSVAVAGPGGAIMHREGKVGLSREDFAAAIKHISRCWEAWEHYQKFRQAPVTELETLAIKQVLAGPDRPKGVLVDIGGQMERRSFDADAEVDEETLEEETRASLARVAPKKRAKKVA